MHGVALFQYGGRRRLKWPNAGYIKGKFSLKETSEQLLRREIIAFGDGRDKDAQGNLYSRSLTDAVAASYHQNFCRIFCHKINYFLS